MYDDYRANDLHGIEMNKAEQSVVPEGATEIDINLVTEDNQQPRKEFNQETLQELTETIKLRGVKSPISVRPNPHKSGHYIINHGARRYRASINAGLNKIPVFIDNDYTEADQIIENLQRDNLTPREIADFIGRQLATGKKKQDVAKEIGKTNGYVTMHATLLELPDPIREIFQAGRCSDITAIYNMTKIFSKYPLELADWLKHNTQNVITRADVQTLKEFLHFNESKDNESVDAYESASRVTTRDIRHKNRIDKKTELLDMLHDQIFIQQQNPEEVLKNLPDDDQKAIKARLKSLFDQGKKHQDALPFFLKEFCDKNYHIKKNKSIELIAFLYGMNKTNTFNLDEMFSTLSNHNM
ncbi:chromosome partitioning protein, ParB family [Nitrosomonas aestuarii]|uniref:Chromosome partitioning protein, ParB family n=2 Tax=Nitrosomonas aestuarii TaxID=52441 RepID=A0A1I4H3T8_9PROT|nr:chromosome partitioning protein, ParB family [Nitrosomonas aestuarii]